MIQREYWETAADYYDAAYAAVPREDIDFWKSVAAQHGGPLLEIACGTGRVGLELIRQGHEYIGVDLSEALLARFREKLAAEPDEAQRRAQLFCGDMRNFDLGCPFRLALIPFRPMQHMLTLEDQIAALETARRHLVPGGILAFDVFSPKFSKLDGPFGVDQAEAEWTTKDRLIMRRFYVRHSVDKINQVLYGSYIFRTYKGDQLISEEISPLTMSFYTHPHLCLLLERAGFQIEEEFGSHAREPMSIANEMIILARAV